MIDQACTDFYKMVRETPALWAELTRIDTREELDAAILEMGKEQGYSLNADVVRSVAADEFLALVQSSANDDELTDEELELVAAGTPIPCGDT